MADKTLSERLQPSLLDRLTDNEPGEMNETKDARVIDISRLREIIQRDLSWLLNSTNIESSLDVAAFPNITKSVVNYGLKEVSGEFSTVERGRENPPVHHPGNNRIRTAHHQRHS